MALFFGLGAFIKLFYVIVLLLNAVSILSEDRFLARIGWGRLQADTGFGGRDDSGAKARSIDLIASVRTVMRIPLIAINTTIIIYEIVLG